MLTGPPDVLVTGDVSEDPLDDVAVGPVVGSPVMGTLLDAPLTPTQT